MLTVPQKTFLVSGVTSGIGKAFAELAQAQGHKIIPIVRDKFTLINYKSYESIVELDFSDTSSIEDAFSGFDSNVDGFVNCAAVLPGKSLFEQRLDGLVKLFNVNIITPMLIIKRIQKNLKPGSCIILLGSISAQKGSYDDPYAATKGAIHSLVKSLSLKFASNNIRVIGIAPGITDNTRMTNNLIEGLYEKNIEKVPLKHAAQTEDIANLILFLSNSYAKSITGAVIDVNGGQYLR